MVYHTDMSEALRPHRDHAVIVVEANPHDIAYKIAQNNNLRRLLTDNQEFFTPDPASDPVQVVMEHGVERAAFTKQTKTGRLITVRFRQDTEAGSVEENTVISSPNYQSEPVAIEDIGRNSYKPLPGLVETTIVDFALPRR